MDMDTSSLTTTMVVSTTIRFVIFYDLLQNMCISDCLIK